MAIDSGFLEARVSNIERLSSDSLSRKSFIFCSKDGSSLGNFVSGIFPLLNVTSLIFFKGLS